jgi:hypothetical protein
MNDARAFLQRTRGRPILLAVACFTSAAALAALVPVVFGRPLPMVHITWESIDEPERQRLEQRFGLSEGVPTPNGAWAYVPADTGPEALRAIISHPAVRATAGIDRRALRLSPGGPLSARRGGALPGIPRGARFAKLAAALLALAGILAVFGATPLPARARRAAQGALADPRTAFSALLSAIQRGIPVASAEAAGAFRICFGMLVVLLVAANRVDRFDLSPSAVASAEGVYGAIVSWLAAHGSIVDALGVFLAVTGVLFVAGVLTAITFPAFVAGFFLWACVLTLHTSHHVVSALHLALVCLLVAPWSDGWSVDAWMRTWRGSAARPPGRRYGYAIWVPGFVLGVAFLAAAVAKLHGGPDWILNGTVKYHFISDLDDALVKWGPWLTRNHLVAVAMSAAAIAIEALVITASFSRSATYRAVAGCGSAALLAGFALFQGVVWPGWWVLLLSFLPWHHIHARSVDVPGQLSLAPLQLAAVVLVAVQQALVSASGTEARPLASQYDMYSATYATPYEYEASENLVYRVIVSRAGKAYELQDCELDDTTAERFRSALEAGKAEHAAGLVLRDCRADSDVAAVTLRGDRHVYDWDAEQFTWRKGIDHIGPIHVGRRSP